jgi:transposase-like protein
MNLVREAEAEGNVPYRVSLKYQVPPTTVMRWLRDYGCGKHGKVIRVKSAGEVDELKRLRQELRTVKEALADAHVALAVEKAYVELACEQMGQSEEDWRKKQDGRPRTGRSKPNGS